MESYGAALLGIIYVDAPRPTASIVWIATKVAVKARDDCQARIRVGRVTPILERDSQASAFYTTGPRQLS